MLRVPPLSAPTAAWRFAALDPRGLAAFRIAIGLIVVADALLRTRDLETMFAADGIFPAPLLREALGGPTAWSLAWLDDSPAWSRGLLLLEGLAGVLLACGCLTPWSCLAAWILVVSIVRRTAPATNAGDLWLACLLLWGIFLPLGATWSIDARRYPDGRRTAAVVVSAASAALVIQIALVYGSAGLSKCNATWLSGDAVGLALSVHDHGTRFGEWLSAARWLTAPCGWALVLLELACPGLLLLRPTARVRMALALAFVLLHGSIWATMSVGLFAPVGIAAWLALLPAPAWDFLGSVSGGEHDPPTPPPFPDADACASRPTPFHIACTALVAVLLSIAVAGAVAAHRPAGGALPDWLRLAIRVTALEQDWRMFGDVRRQTQWLRAEARLADGRVVDLLRDGEVVAAGPPPAGYQSLPHHRWHKLCWDLHRPVQRAFAGPLATTLADRWNRVHPPNARAISVEIRNGRCRDGNTEEILLASWPPRSPTGRGNLDRFLDAAPDRPGNGAGETAP